MSNHADVKSIDAIRGFRPAWIVFSEECMAAVSSAVSSAVRTLDWVQKTQTAHWKHEVRRRTDEVTSRKLELERKKLSASGDPRSAVEERKAYERARHRLDIARQRSDAVRLWSRTLQREVDQLRGDVQPLQTFVASQVPKVLASLERMSGLLDEYVAIQVPESALPGSDGSGDADVGREAGGGVSMGISPGATEADGAKEVAAALRARVPDRSVRLAAEAGRVRPKPLHMTLLARNEVVGSLPGDRENPEPGETLTFAPGWEKGSKSAMVRVGRASGSDSGWHVMPYREPELAEAVEGVGEAELEEPCKVATVETFVKARPEHRAVLALPQGSVVVLEQGEVIEIYDADNAGLFRRAGDSV